jgi:hypothetical protein
MFDPAIFENLRVVLEGAVYDRDLEGEALVTGRSDLLDLAVMSRRYAIRLTRQTAGDRTVNSPRSARGRSEAEINLAAGLEDFAGEKLKEEPFGQPGCDLWIEYVLEIPGDDVCGHIRNVLKRQWGEGVAIRQQVAYDDSHPDVRRLTSAVWFQRKINERQIDDLPELVDHVLRTLEELDQLFD